MKRIVSALISALVMTSFAIPAFGWGSTGHKTVGQIAQLRLTGTSTLTKIEQILRPGETLANVANWADSVKNEKKFRPQAYHTDPDTQDFYRQMTNKDNGDWHFVDLPLGCSSYNNCPASFRDDADIVKMINLCIRELRGEAVPNLTRRNALRMLVHLVGDIHQPLHVGVGYINTDGPGNNIVFESNPSVIIQNDFSSDIGGNRLLLRNEDSDNLHSYWDTDLVEDARGDRTVVQFATALNIDSQPGWTSQGNAYTWSAQWASDTLRVSKEKAYPTIRIRKEVIIDYRTKYQITKGNEYGAGNVQVVKLQLAKGGYRLAELLRAIFP